MYAALSAVIGGDRSYRTPRVTCSPARPITTRLSDGWNPSTYGVTARSSAAERTMIVQSGVMPERLARERGAGRAERRACGRHAGRPQGLRAELQLVQFEALLLPLVRMTIQVHGQLDRRDHVVAGRVQTADRVHVARR